MKLRIIFNADDFGLTRSICDSIENAHKNGVLTSTTLLVSSACAPYAAKIAERNPGLSVGIHFQLVAGKPVYQDISRVRTLADENGMFPSGFCQFFKKLHTGGIDRNHIRIELLSQIKKAMALGFKITHADSHQHIHMHPMVLPVVLEVMRESGIKKLRNPVEVFNLNLHRTMKVGAGNIIKMFYMNPLYKRWFDSRLDAVGVSYPEFFFGQYFSGDMDIEKVASFLNFIRISGCGRGLTTCEVMLHPGSSCENLNIVNCDSDFARYRWKDEHDLLVSPKMRELLSSYGFELTNYAGL